MHTSLKDIPPALICSLGRSSLSPSLLPTLEELGAPTRDMLRTQHGQAYIYKAGQLGLDLGLQCINAQVEAAQQQWGLQSVTFYAPAFPDGPHWKGAWMAALDARRLVASEVGRVFDTEPAMQTSALVVLELPGHEDVPCGCLLQFDAAGQNLQSVMLKHIGDWVQNTHSPLPQPEPQPPAAPTPAPYVPPVTCRSGEPTPQTGIYEGRLPIWHIKAPYYNTTRGRFCLKQKGEPMLRLGVVPFEDEALVEWTWLKAG